MNIKLEDIDFLRERANVSYNEAKQALEKSNGDILEAILYLEKENKVKQKGILGCENKFFDKVKSFLKKANKTKLIIKKEESTALNIPITLAALFTVISIHSVIIGILIALFSGYKIKIRKENGLDMEASKIFDRASDIVNNINK